MKKTALIFPGQGSQYVGMAGAFLESDPEAARLMTMAGEASGLPLRKLCLDGPMEELTRVLHLQPAVTVTNLICLRALQTSLPDFEPAFCAGHSLGEYSALVAAGVVDPADCLALVTRRGELMEREGRANPGGMRAVLGLKIDEVDELLRENSSGVVVVANHNTETQVVVSGDAEGLDSFSALCAQRGAKVIPLKVSVANHSPLVAGAVEDFAGFMAGVPFHPPKIPVIFNVTAGVEEDPAEIRSIMARQIASRVRWYESVERMVAEGVEVFVEVGPGKVLTGIVRKIVPRGSVECVRFDTPSDLEKVVEIITA